MSTVKSNVRPMTETWYRTSQGDVFEVVAVDEQEDAIEIQFLDGSVEELDEEAWSSLAPKAIDAPRDAPGQDEDEGGAVVDYDDEANEEDWHGADDDVD